MVTVLSDELTALSTAATCCHLLWPTAVATKQYVLYELHLTNKHLNDSPLVSGLILYLETFMRSFALTIYGWTWAFKIFSTQICVFLTFTVHPLKCLTLLTFISAKFVTRQVFSHASTEGGDVWALPWNLTFKSITSKLDLVHFVTMKANHCKCRHIIRETVLNTTPAKKLETSSTEPRFITLYHPLPVTS